MRIVGIAGGSGSGKTTIVTRLTEIVRDYALVPQDNYYKSAEHVTNASITGFNFDHPDAFDTDLLVAQVRELKAGRAVDKPIYSFAEHTRTRDTVRVDPGVYVPRWQSEMLARRAAARECGDTSSPPEKPQNQRLHETRVH